MYRLGWIPTNIKLVYVHFDNIVFEKKHWHSLQYTEDIRIYFIKNILSARFQMYFL